MTLQRQWAVYTAHWSVIDTARVIPSARVIPLRAKFLFFHQNFRLSQSIGLYLQYSMGCTASSVEDETRNDRRNANRNPEWWGDFSQLVEIEKLKFIGISRYKFKLRF